MLYKCHINRAKTASAFTDYRGQGAVVLICFGLPCYPSQGAQQESLEVEIVRNQPFATLKSTFFQAAFLWKGCFIHTDKALFFASLWRVSKSTI